MKPVLALFLCLTVYGLAGNLCYGDDLTAARERFGLAYEALTKGQQTQAKKLIAGLENYPLYIYYEYYELSRRLHHKKPSDVRDFLARYDGSLLAERLRTAWLTHLKRLRRWNDFLHDYRPQGSTELKCAYVTARIESGTLQGVADDARSLWLIGKSQPAECDVAFAHLKSSGLLDDQLIWQRIRLAFSNNQPRLARYLSQLLKSKRLRASTDAWLAVHTDTLRGLNTPYFKDDSPQAREIVIHGVGRLARSQLSKAEAIWAKFANRYEFGDLEIGRARRLLALAAAGQEHARRIELLDNIPDGHVDDLVEKYRIQAALQERAWKELVRWTEQAPMGETDILRWRYWRGRALQSLQRTQEAKSIFRELARRRDYYGFLSADQLGLKYEMNDRPVVPTEVESGEMKARPGLIRSRELYRLDMRFMARREWAYEMGRLTPRQLEVAAYIVHDWGWNDRAIVALGKARSYDDLIIRFPLLYENVIRRYAAKRGLAPSLVYGIIRTESAFMDDARSAAGALGLMQLMPKTGRETARRVGIKLASARELLDPQKNVNLGSAYLKQMLDRFDGSFSLAAAAYNAGPHRAKNWRPKSGCVPADIWVDTIPFKETRRYVRRASFYATVYQWRLKEEIEPLRKRLMDVSPAGVTQQC